MSGGAYDYLYTKIRYTYENEMEDSDLEIFMGDICDLLHDLEWYKSGDTSQTEYLKSVKDFKSKWLK